MLLPSDGAAVDPAVGEGVGGLDADPSSVEHTNASSATSLVRGGASTSSGMKLYPPPTVRSITIVNPAFDESMFLKLAARK
jgi:hypothetical protein